MIEQKKLREQVKKIIALAEKSGTQSNFLFLTAFKKYLELSDFADALEKEARKERKELGGYAKSAAVEQHGRTVDRSVKTMNVIIRIIKEFDMLKKKTKKEPLDPLIKLLNGEKHE